MVGSAWGVKQGFNVCPFCFSAGSLKILEEVRTNPPMPERRSISFITNITVNLPPMLSIYIAAIVKVDKWLQERLGVESVALSRNKPQDLLADGVGPEHLTEDRCVAMNGDEWRRPHGGPTGDDDSRSTSWNRPVQTGFLERVVNGKPVELVRGAHLDR